jgi:Nitrile hydratase, alpha chain
MADDEATRRLGRVIAKAWSDEGFKARLLADPVATLKAEGVAVSPGVQVRVVENTDSVVHFVLPLKPKRGHLSEEELETIAGGNCVCGKELERLV